MLPPSTDWKRLRVELAARRSELFKRFVRNPADIRLAGEIRLLDDQILECSEHMESERRHQD